MAAPVIKTIPIKHCNFEAKVKTAGNGPPLVYLHPAGGPLWDDFVEGLTERYTVYAPHHPGTGETVREFDLFSREPVGSGADLRRNFRCARFALSPGGRDLIRRHDGV